MVNKKAVAGKAGAQRTSKRATNATIQALAHLGKHGPERFGQLRDELVPIGVHGHVRGPEQGGTAVVVDAHDHARALNADEMIEVAA